MRLFKIISFVLLGIFFLFLVHSSSLLTAIHADNDPCQQSTYDSVGCQNQINNYQKQLDAARGQEKTLQSQLDFIDAQTKITELKIQNASFQIQKLNSEITDLSGRIDRLSTSVDSLTKVLLDRIVRTYKYSNISPLDLLFSSNGFSDALERLKYIQVVQAHDKQVLYQFQAAKQNFDDQKTDKVTRQTQAEELKKQLDSYQAQLDSDKAAKAQLLRITQDNETVYQQKLQAALSEQEAILAILGGGGSEVSVGPVHQGDVISHFIIGPSPCSSGSHLHFEVHQNNSLVNPTGLLSNTSINKWDNSPDSPFSFSGSWPWPVQQPIDIEQGFGNTWWAQHGWYTNPPGHTGIDIYSESSTEVLAVHDGNLSVGSISCGGGTLHYVKVDHGDGYSSYYLHTLR